MTDEIGGEQPPSPSAATPGGGQGLPDRIAGWVALVGGVITLGIAVVLTISAAKRGLTRQALPGDFEIVEYFTAIAAFCFFPICMLVRGHIFVNSFTEWLPQRWQSSIDGLWDLVFAAFALIMGWQMLLGGLETYRYGTGTLVLKLPIGVGIIICSVLLALKAWTSFVSAWRAMRGNK